jgi:thiamine-monophosphate kinase
MIDVSDGLLLDARRLCRSSRTGLALDTASIPRTPGTTLRETLTDGEDYELLFAVSRRRAKRLKAEWPFKDTALTEIGRFVASESPVVYGPDGSPITVKGKEGYDHFLAGV